MIQKIKFRCIELLIIMYQYNEIIYFLMLNSTSFLDISVRRASLTAGSFIFPFSNNVSWKYINIYDVLLFETRRTYTNIILRASRYICWYIYCDHGEQRWDSVAERQNCKLTCYLNFYFLPFRYCSSHPSIFITVAFRAVVHEVNVYIYVGGSLQRKLRRWCTRCCKIIPKYWNSY